MDSNVSKNTNSHNFFKLRVNQEKLGISVKNLLKQELRSILDLYQHKFNVKIEQKILTRILADKIAISNQKNSSTSLNNNSLHLFSAKFLPIKYGCPIGLFLAANLQLSPQEIMTQLGALPISGRDDLSLEFSGDLLTEIVSLGWLNFYLDSQFIAGWLQRSLVWLQANTLDQQQSAEETICSLAQTPAKLFPAQYIHARCCSLLRLGARASLITLDENIEQNIWQIQQPQSILWLDQQSHLWLREIAEHKLLQQLLVVTDSWFEDTSEGHWSKLALSLSQNTSIFLAQCRFLGEVRQEHFQKAHSHLSLSKIFMEILPVQILHWP